MNAKDVAALGALSLLWGSVYVLTRLGLDELSPVQVVFGRTALGSLGLAPFVLVARRRVRLGASAGWVAAVVLTQATFPLLLQTTGQLHVILAQAGVLLATEPIFARLMALAEVPQGCSPKFPTWWGGQGSWSGCAGGGAAEGVGAGVVVA